MGQLTAGEFAKAVAAERYAAETDDPWLCEACEEARKYRVKCAVCRGPYCEKRTGPSGKLETFVYDEAPGE